MDSMHTKSPAPNAVLITVSEAARRASLSRSFAYALIERGIMPCVRIGTAVRVPVRAFERWIEQGCPASIVSTGGPVA